MQNDVESLLVRKPFKKLAWLIERFEGFRTKTYYDSVGKATIGYGHEILNHDESLIFLKLTLLQLTEGITEEIAQRLLAHDILSRANINIFNIPNLLDHQWIALTSFCFNIGENNFRKSSALKLMNEGKLYEAADSLCSWRDSNEIFSEGIAKRRLCEMLILLQKEISIESRLSITQQLKSPYSMKFSDENWAKLSPLHKLDMLNTCKAFNNYQV